MLYRYIFYGISCTYFSVGFKRLFGGGGSTEFRFRGGGFSDRRVKAGTFKKAVSAAVRSLWIYNYCFFLVFWIMLSTDF